MIDYDTYCRIKQLSDHERLSVVQIARTLALDVRTVAQWRAEPRYRPRRSVARRSKLDAFKPTIRRLLEHHPYSAAQLFGRLTEDGYTGGITILNDYLRTVRPPRKPAFLTLAFAPGECAQVDWGQYHCVAVGHTRRKLSFFVMVLAYSRMMYLEFTVSQTMEHFLACHQHAFEYFGHLVPETIMVDNLKSAVLKRLTGHAPVFNPRYLDIPEFTALNPAARHWLDTVANVRVHGETRKPPRELFKLEQPLLRPMSANLYDIGSMHNVCASNRFRVTFETNRYSVPAEYASQRLTLKAYPERICLYQGDKLIARHPRSFDKHRDFEDPDHPKALLAQRRSARHHKLLQRFLALSPKAEAYYRALQLRRLNARHHVTQIVALSEIYGTEAVARALDNALAFDAVSCEYIANLIESRARALPEPSALHLTRRSDLLDIELPEPNLDLFDTNDE